MLIVVILWIKPIEHNNSIKPLKSFTKISSRSASTKFGVKIALNELQQLVALSASITRYEYLIFTLYVVDFTYLKRGARVQQQSDRILGLRSRGRWFERYHCKVSLSKTHFILSTKSILKSRPECTQ